MTVTFVEGLLLGWMGVNAAGLARAPAQEKPSVVTIIPSADWQLVSSRNIDASALKGWGGDPAIEREYGVSSFTERTYQFENHTAEALLEQAHDPSSAYGLWTFYRTEAMAAVSGMALSVTSREGALLVRGPVFIRVWRPQNYPLLASDYRALLERVGGSPPSPRALEQLPPALPPRGLIPESDKYLLGPVAAARVLPSFPAELLGFEKGAEVQVARYSTGPAGLVTLAAISYPTPQIARPAFDSIRSFLRRPAPGGASWACRRQDAYVLIVLKAPSLAVADRFLDEFKVSKVMSEDQAYPRDRAMAMQLVDLVLANAMLILVLLCVSLAGGLIVFASKRLARKWFAHSLWVEGEEGGIIVLNLR